MKKKTSKKTTIQQEQAEDTLELAASNHFSEERQDTELHATQESEQPVADSPPTMSDKAEEVDSIEKEIEERIHAATSEEFAQHQQDDDRLTIPDFLPVLPLKDTVVYPFSVQPLGVGQERSIRLIDDVMRGNRLVVLVAQKSAELEQAGPDDIFKIGTVSRIASMIRMPDGTIQ